MSHAKKLLLLAGLALAGTWTLGVRESEAGCFRFRSGCYRSCYSSCWNPCYRSCWYDYCCYRPYVRYCQPTYCYRPTYVQPLVIQPVYTQPVYTQPVYAQPVYTQPIVQPIVQPVVQHAPNCLCQYGYPCTCGAQGINPALGQPQIVNAAFQTPVFTVPATTLPNAALFRNVSFTPAYGW